MPPLEYVKVRFSSPRRVIIDGVDSGGMTQQTLRVNTGTHKFDLGDPPDYTPPFAICEVKETGPINPTLVDFEPTPQDGGDDVG